MTFGPEWEVVLAARAGNYTKETQVANVSLDRRADGAGGKEVKFELIVKPLDATHTHGEIERCDKAAVMLVLKKAADEIVDILRRVPPKPS